MEKRTCPTCLIEKDLNENNFYVRKDRGKINFRKDCKECVKIKRADYRKENKEKVYAATSVWLQKNKEYVKEKQKKRYEEKKELIIFKAKQYYQKNKDSLRISSKKWYERNKDKGYQYSLKRRSLKHFVRFEGIKRKELLDRDNWKCQLCNVTVHDRSEGGNENRHLWDDEFKAHIDHIIPISRGGDSTPENLRVLCRTCNLSKSDKTDIVIKEDGQIALFI